MTVWVVHYERPDGFLNLYGVFTTAEKAMEAKTTLVRANPTYIADIATRKMDEACFNPVILAAGGDGGMDSELWNLMFGDCLEAARRLPFDTRIRLGKEMAEEMGCSMMRPDATAALALYTIARGREMPEWAGEDLREAVARARAAEMAAEVAEKIGGR